MSYYTLCTHTCSNYAKILDVSTGIPVTALPVRVATEVCENSDKPIRQSRLLNPTLNPKPFIGPQKHLVVS